MMIENKTIITETLLALIELEMGTFPLETANDTTNNYAIDFLINNEMREKSLGDFVTKVLTPIACKFTHILSKEDRFCFVPEATLEQLATRDSNCSYMKAGDKNIEVLLIESYDLEMKSQRISIQLFVNKG